MARNGYSPAQIAAHLGHADGGVLALRAYIHAEPLDDASFIDKKLAAPDGSIGFEQRDRVVV